MSGVPFGPAARILPIKGTAADEPNLQKQNSQKLGVPSSPPRTKMFEQVFARPALQDLSHSRPSTTETQTSVASGNVGELLCDYYSTTEALVEYLVHLLGPTTTSPPQRLPDNIVDVTSIPSLPELKACDATCREWLAHHRLLYATPGHSSYAIINGVCVVWVHTFQQHLCSPELSTHQNRPPIHFPPPETSDVIVNLLEFLAAHNWGMLPDAAVCTEWTALLQRAKHQLVSEVDAEALRAASDSGLAADILSL